MRWRATSKGYGVDFLEQLLAINRFVRFLMEKGGVKLDRQTRRRTGWASRSGTYFTNTNNTNKYRKQTSRR